MKYIKSPINWVGNKYKYLDIINELIKDKEYNLAIDLFMGSGNVILNLDCKARLFVGNDKQKLVPKLYTELPKYIYSLDDLKTILNKFNNFSHKDDYYTFRDYWNEKFLNDNFDKDFIIETVLLTKMCSNSMVRFNPKKGYFNQGFRGLGKKKEFFTESMKELVIKGLNDLKEKLSNDKYYFINIDFKDYSDRGNDNLLILDPPYVLRADMYDTDFTKELDDKLLNLIATTENDFVYFNYLVRDGKEHIELKNIIDEKGFKVIDINDKTLAGQGRSKNTREVREVIVTNIK